MNHCRKQVSSISTAIGLLALVGVSQAAPVIYIAGGDAAISPAAISGEARASALAFDTAAGLLGPAVKIDFESAALGNFGSGSLSLDQNTSISSSSSTGSIRDAPNCSYLMCGGNTTPSGSHFANGLGGDLVFSFVTPVNSFGAYFTGINSWYLAEGEGVVYTTRGGIQHSVEFLSMWGGAAFVGFTDAGALIDSITIYFYHPWQDPERWGDVVSVDDVRYVMAAVPEPESYAMFMAGLGLMGFIARRRKNGQA